MTSDFSARAAHRLSLVGAEIVEDHDVARLERLVFLPKYSPDLNPIEQVSAQFKTLLGKAGARTYEAISDACGKILAHYPPAECAAYLKNAGYA